MTNNKWFIGIIALIVGILIGVFVPGLFNQTPSLAGATAPGVKLAEQYDPYVKYNGGYNSAKPIQTSGGMYIGATGSATGLNNVAAGQCYILAYATTIAASSSAKVECQGTAAIGNTNTTFATPLAGVQPNDSVVVTLSTTTSGTIVQGLDVNAASASTTPGYITLYISNQTGATYTWPTTGVATGTVSYIDYR